MMMFVCDGPTRPPGAIRADATSVLNATACAFSDNANAYGGVIFAYESRVVFRGCAFEGNSGVLGGAVQARGALGGACRLSVCPPSAPLALWPSGWALKPHLPPSSFSFCGVMHTCRARRATSA